jgi:mRNA-degrading endonuclease YafQ of YafQ-DinJ toxin-antitoxin module
VKGTISVKQNVLAKRIPGATTFQMADLAGWLMQCREHHVPADATVWIYDVNPGDEGALVMVTWPTEVVK